MSFYVIRRKDPFAKINLSGKDSPQSSDNHNAIDRGGLSAVFLCLPGLHKQALQDRIRRKQ